MKRFLLKFAFTFLPIWLILVLGVTFISVCICPQLSGDIGRLGMIPFGHEYDEHLEDSWLTEKSFTTIEDIDMLQRVKTDVLTIGDSFSQRDRDAYQNYLCTKGVSVANCERHMFYNPVTFAYEVMDLEIIDSTRVHTLIVEVVERAFESFLTNFKPNLQKSTIITAKKKIKDKSPNEWSLSRARDYLFYRTGYVECPVFKATLDGDFFSSNEPQALYYYNEDLKDVSIKKSSEVKIMSTYQALVEKAAEKHINIIFMVAVDKYDLYQDHIVDNPYPHKNVNEDIDRILNKDRRLLLTKKCLFPMVERGEKDVFLFNDSHWSYKAGKVVADELWKMMNDDRE